MYAQSVPMDFAWKVTMTSQSHFVICVSYWYISIYLHTKHVQCTAKQVVMLDMHIGIMGNRVLGFDHMWIMAVYVIIAGH